MKKIIELSTELEDEFFSMNDDFLWELFEPTALANGDSDLEKASDESLVHVSPLSVSCSNGLVGSSIDADITERYRKEAIMRWRKKRERRCFKKKIVSKARKDYADSRERKGGRFVKSKSSGWVSITDVTHGI